MKYRPWIGEDVYECVMEEEGMNPYSICGDEEEEENRENCMTEKRCFIKGGDF